MVEQLQVKIQEQLAIIENLARFQIGDETVTELILNQESVNGTFQVGEEVSGTTSDIDDYFIKADITGIPGTKTITNTGSLYKIDDTIKVIRWYWCIISNIRYWNR